MKRRRLRQFWRSIPRPVRIVLAVTVGGTLVIIGLAMIVLPGPAIIVLPLGLAVLALEFAFARRWLKKLKESAKNVQQRLKNGFQKSDQAQPGHGC